MGHAYRFPAFSPFSFSAPSFFLARASGLCLWRLLRWDAPHQLRQGPEEGTGTGHLKGTASAPEKAYDVPQFHPAQFRNGLNLALHRPCAVLPPANKSYFGDTFSRSLHHLANHPFSTTATNGACEGQESKEKISVTFVDKDGEEKTISVPLGMSMLEAAHENDIELEGACEGSLACSTCHLIVMDVNYYNKLEEPTDEENDMLDLAFGLTETSRLGCQIIAKPELDGIRLALPAATRNFAVDGYVPKPH